MNYQLIEPTDIRLNIVSREVGRDEISGQMIGELIRGLKEVAGANIAGEKRRTLVGLAAPQIGENLRIILVDTSASGEKGAGGDQRIYINPKILNHSETVNLNREGCFSTGMVCGVPERYDWVEIEALNEQGELVKERHEGFVARIFQHEIDHLDGIRFPDRLTDRNKLHWVESEQFLDYRHGWPNWSEICPWEKWLEVKYGPNFKEETSSTE